MCGICGIINLNRKAIDFKLLKAMNNSQHHRGPDDEKYMIDGNVGFGFKRLSIIDLKHGQQPMSDINKTTWIVFNGEIYNYKELQTKLIKKGYKFQTNSDTEVIINTYKEYGESCVNKFRGMFAFAIWDKRKNSLFMARDQFGIKPLYYLKNEYGIVFSSELKALLKTDFSKREIDVRAIDSFFTYGHILSPYSIYTDIKKLPAAHTININLNKTNQEFIPQEYWHPVFNIDTNISFEEYKSLIRQKLEESVEKHLVSDVPVGTFLSGGIDSNSVVSLMAKLYPSKIKTFTIGFKENNYDESKLAEITAKKYNTEHHKLIIDKQSSLHLEKIIKMFDEPFADSSAIPTYFVSKLAAEHVKVVLSGDGGDEFFGGYDSYQRLNKMNNFLKTPYHIRYPVFRILSKILPEKLPGKRFSYTMAQERNYAFAFFNLMWHDEKAKVFNKDLLYEIRKNPVQNIKIDYIKKSQSKDFLSKMMELDVLTKLTDDILTKVDRASMANSLEVRVPIIDQEIFKLASKIPSDFKVNRNQGKYILREAMREQLPEEIYTFKKQGFTIPINQWFKTDLNDFVHDSINSGNKLNDFIQPSYLKKIKNTKNLGSLITRLWPIIVFNNWLNNIHKE
jgi:asparagine synthase (glutamine-hydrolysing)